MVNIGRKKSNQFGMYRMQTENIVWVISQKLKDVGS